MAQPHSPEPDGAPATGREAGGGSIGMELPRRRRRLGLALVGVGVFALAAQSWVEWLLPYDLGALETVRRLTHSPTLGPTQLVWLWALLCAALGVALVRAHARALPLALACGAALGSAQVAAGGAAASLAMLLLVAVASLGWHGRREGGLALLLATAVTMAAWDAAQTSYPSLWISALAVCGTFIWIERQDRRLFRALAERDSLITSLDQRTAELTALQGARTRLLAGISHDLRQPLQAVRLFAEALQSRPADDSPAATRWHDLLRQQMRAADDAVAMLDQFSEFSAIEQGALQSHAEAFDLRELLDGGHIPVVSPLSCTIDGTPLNINADTVAAAIGAQLGAEKLILCTGAAGIFESLADPSSLVS